MLINNEIKSSSKESELNTRRELSNINKNMFVDNIIIVNKDINLNPYNDYTSDFLDDLMVVFKKFGVISLSNSEIVYNEEVDKLSIKNAIMTISNDSYALIHV